MSTVPTAESIQAKGALPIVYQDESGDTYYAEGHVDPARFALAVVVDMASTNDDGAALDLLCGAQRTRKAASEFLGLVRHSWWRQIEGQDPEAMVRCGSGSPGARPFTEYDL